MARKAKTWQELRECLASLRRVCAADRDVEDGQMMVAAEVLHGSVDLGQLVLDCGGARHLGAVAGGHFDEVRDGVLDAYGVVILPTTGRYFQVPYGIILPQKIENLLVAGRCAAGDKISHAATRQMMCCAVTGQGAGTAAAVSLKDNVTCREVDISKVQKALKKQGVRIE